MISHFRMRTGRWQRARENVSSVDIPEQDGKEAHKEWSWDEYILVRAWRANLAEDIESNLDAWMGYGREADRQAAKVDSYQLRADTDPLLILNGLNKEEIWHQRLFELAREYYKNGAWTLDYLNALAKAGKLTAEEYQEITGVALASLTEEERQA